MPKAKHRPPPPANRSTGDAVAKPQTMPRQTDNNTPSEQLLQVVWQHQRLLRGRLKTLDGKSVRVLHPGFKNHEAGPDFRDAVIQIDGAAPKSGDIEIDLEANGWRAHGHHTNPAFKKVMLHVIWEGKRAVAAGL